VTSCGGHIRARVLKIGNAILVVVVVRAAVLILESVEVFGDVDTSVCCICNPIGVVVMVRAPVRVGKSIYVLR